MLRPTKQPHKNHNFFNDLPDDLVVFILSKLSSTASSRSHFFNIFVTCKRWNRLGLSPTVLSKIGPKVLVVNPKYWSESADRFLRRCINAGNADACYTLGMIRFYCLQNRKSGLSLIAKAAMRNHAPALYSLSVIQFNGSGGTKQSKDLTAGVVLSARAAQLGHIDALREFGYCLQDGYGVKKDVTGGRRLLVQANLRELILALRAIVLESPSRATPFQLNLFRSLSEDAVLIRDIEYNARVPDMYPVHWFLREWFESGRGVLEDGLRLCAHGGCGRAETRLHEFRRCSVCGKVNYCSRGCQSLDWKLKHKMECLPERLFDVNNGGGDVNIGNEVVQNGGD